MPADVEIPAPVYMVFFSMSWAVLLWFMSYKNDYLLCLALFDILRQSLGRPRTQCERPGGRIDHARLFVAHLANTSCLPSVSILRTILVGFVFAPRLVLLSLLAKFLASATYLGVVEGW